MNPETQVFDQICDPTYVITAHGVCAHCYSTCAITLCRCANILMALCCVSHAQLLAKSDLFCSHDVAYASVGVKSEIKEATFHNFFQTHFCSGFRSNLQILKKIIV